MKKQKKNYQVTRYFYNPMYLFGKKLLNLIPKILLGVGMVAILLFILIAFC